MSRCNVSLRAVLLLLGVGVRAVCCSPAIASVASALFEVRGNVSIIANYEVWESLNGPDYGWTPAGDLRGFGSGFSFARHAAPPLESEPLHVVGDTWAEETSRNGDVENAHDQVVWFGAYIPTASFVSLSILTESQSQAAGDPPPGIHGAGTTSSTGLYTKFSVERTTTLGLATPPLFRVKFSAPDAAIHMKTEVAGNAMATADFKIAMLGTLTNKNESNPVTAMLTPLVLMSHKLSGNDEYFSPNVEQSLAFSLPDWTRLVGAKFDLELGLQLVANTRANVVPEPGSFTLTALGLLAWCEVRRRKGIHCRRSFRHDATAFC